MNTKAIVNYVCLKNDLLFMKIVLKGNNMEDGGVDTTVIDCQQNQFGQVADFPLLTFKISDL